MGSTSDNDEGVQGVSVKSPYDGVTDKGIGIGTSRETVIQLIGEPNYINETTHAETYLYEQVNFKLFYGNAQINTIMMHAGDK